MKQSIAIDAVKLTTSKIVNISISMVIAMLLSRFRTLEEYGTYSQLLLVINLIVTIFMLGLPNSINFFLAGAESAEERQKFLSSYYTLSTILSFVTGLVLVLITPLISSYFDNAIIKNFMYVLAVYPWAKIILSSIDNIYIVYKKTTQLMLFRILNSISLLLIILLVEAFNWGFSMYMILFVAVETVFALSVYIIAKNVAGKIWVCLDKDLIRKIFKFSVPLGLASIVGTLSIELDKLLIGRFFNTEQLAIYTNAAREMPVTIIASSLTAVLMPQLVGLLKKNKNEKAIALWGEATSLSYVFICFFAAGLFTFAPEVISLLYSDKYLPGVTVFRIYNIVLLLRCTYFGMILNSIGKTKFILYSSIAALGLNVVMNYIFYLIFGFIGPAIATFIAIAVVVAFQLLATSRSINVPFKKLLPWMNLGVITILNFAMGILFSFIKEAVMLEFLTGEIIESIIWGAIWGILYGLIMAKFVKQKWTSLNGNSQLDNGDLSKY